MLLAFASAPDKPFLLELTFDASLPAYALLAREAASSTLVFVQLRPWELQMALVAALHARIRGDIARGEPAFRAEKAQSPALVPFCIAQHALVELGSV